MRCRDDLGLLQSRVRPAYQEANFTQVIPESPETKTSPLATRYSLATRLAENPTATSDNSFVPTGELISTHFPRKRAAIDTPPTA
jgi:hypothetical protein